MELPKIKNSHFDKFGSLKFNNQFPSRDGLVLKTLQNDNIFIKKKLAEFENKLDNLVSKKSYDYTDELLDFKNEPSKLLAKRERRKAKSSRPNLFKVNDELKVESSDTFKENSNNFSIPIRHFDTNQTRSSIEFNKNPNFQSSTEDVSVTKLESASLIGSFNNKINSARKGELISRINSARTIDSSKSFISAKSNESTESVKKIVDILDNLKAHRRSASRKSKVDEKLRPKTSSTVPEISKNSNLNQDEIKNGNTKNDRTKSANPKKSKDDYQHMFYSRSWRIHCEFIQEEPDMKKPWDNTSPFFYNTKKKQPETFIFAPDWI